MCEPTKWKRFFGNLSKFLLGYYCLSWLNKVEKINMKGCVNQRTSWLKVNRHQSINVPSIDFVGGDECSDSVPIGTGDLILATRFQAILLWCVRFLWFFWVFATYRFCLPVLKSVTTSGSTWFQSVQTTSFGASLSLFIGF